MKALVLFSGGLDSSTCLALAIEKYGKENVLALSISYGQKHSKEINAARAVAEYYGTELVSLDLAPIFEGSDCALLEGSNQAIPKGDYANQLVSSDGKPVSTYVPFRNGLFLSCAASVALSRGCGVIYYGVHSDDAAGSAYPDCSSDFNNHMSKAISIGSAQQLKVVAPFVDRTKADVVAQGLRLGVPYELTWSCYEGNDKPCGCCGTCIDRAKAFAANGVKDPALS
jgi:7-cyano-7-deazaguanine synthase